MAKSKCSGQPVIDGTTSKEYGASRQTIRRVSAPARRRGIGANYLSHYGRGSTMAGSQTHAARRWVVLSRSSIRSGLLENMREFMGKKTAPCEAAIEILIVSKNDILANRICACVH